MEKIVNGANFKLTATSDDIIHSFNGELYKVTVNFIDIKNDRNILKRLEVRMSEEYVSDKQRLSNDYLKEHSGPQDRDVAYTAMEAAFERYQALGNKIPPESDITLTNS